MQLPPVRSISTPNAFRKTAHRCHKKSQAVMILYAVSRSLDFAANAPDFPGTDETQQFLIRNGSCGRDDQFTSCCPSLTGVGMA